MTRTVVAIYETFEHANMAVRELVDIGAPRDNISLIANNARGEYSYHEGSVEDMDTGADSVAEETGAGAGVGAGLGAAVGGIGGLLVGLGALTVPGIGPVIAAGPLAVALSTLTGAGVGVVAGGVTGGLLGALIGLGIPEEEAEYHAEGVRRGAVLLTVQVDDRNTNQVMDLLNRHDPIDIKERAARWREEGWTGFDPKAERHTSEESELYQSTIRTSEFDTDFDMESPAYRDHYQRDLADTGYPYDYYVPAYRYGYGLANDARYQNRTWDQVEPDVRRDWEREHPGSWERFKSSIRRAWDRAFD